MTSRGTFLALLLVLAALPATTSAQEAPESPDEVWTEPRTIDGFLQVKNGTRLTIRDTIVQLGGGFDVHPTGVLVLESTGKPTGFVAKNESGWTGFLYGGTLYANGTPESPILFDGVAGIGTSTGDTILFTTGLEFSGRFEANHLRIQNYTSGLRSGVNSTFVLRNTTFASPSGLGLVASLGTIEGEHLRFEGRGAGFWSVADGKATFRDLTFNDTAIAVMSNGNYTFIDGLRVRDSEGCIRTTVGTFRATDVECIGFNGTAISISKPVKGFRLPNATVRNARIATDAPEAAIAVHVYKAPNTVLDGLDIGPVPQQGIVAESMVPTMSNLTFRGTGHYAVVIMDAERDLPTQRIGTGTPGEEGWLLVGYRFQARVYDAEGRPAPGAVVEARYANGTLALRKTAGAGGTTQPSIISLRTIDAEGTVHEDSYILRAYDRNTSASWTREGYVPDGDPLLISLVAGAAPRPTSNGIPAPSPVLLLGVLIGVGIALRYRRTRI